MLSARGGWNGGHSGARWFMATMADPTCVYQEQFSFPHEVKDVMKFCEIQPTKNKKLHNNAPYKYYY